MKIEFETVHQAVKRCIDEDGFLAMIAECAYFKAEKRGFTDGYALQDWLEAEQEIYEQCFYWFLDAG